MKAIFSSSIYYVSLFFIVDIGSHMESVSQYRSANVVRLHSYTIIYSYQYIQKGYFFVNKNLFGTQKMMGG